MSDTKHGTGDVQAETGVRAGAQLGVLLACFGTYNAAGKARHGLHAQLTSQGDALLDTVVLRVNAHHKASVYDPRRVVQGTLTALVTWGVFGLVSGGLESLALWAIIGAVCGALWAFYTEHLATKNELTRIGARLPVNSSALAVFVETRDPPSLLTASATYSPTAASVAVIGNDLETRVITGAAQPPPRSRSGSAPPAVQTSPLSMILLRYPDPGTAKQMASRAAPKSKKDTGPFQVELVIRADRNGRRHVADPTQGVAAWAKSDLVSWGVFGVVVGALAGAFGDGGVHSFVTDAVVTGIGWAVFGLIAGALYGLWAGRAVSARRLKSVGPLLAPGTSMLVVWAGKPVTDNTLDGYLTPGSQRLVLQFNPVEGGAVLEAV